MNIETFSAAHVDAAAALHRRHLGGLLTKMGSRAVHQWYAQCARSKHCIAFVAIDSGVVQGFVLGADSTAALRRDAMIRNFPFPILGTALSLAGHPTAFWMWLTSPKPTYDASEPELLYLAVDPGSRRGGTGRRLVEAFAGAVRARGRKQYALSVEARNRDAVAFYERLGLTRISEYREFGEDYLRLGARLA